MRPACVLEDVIVRELGLGDDTLAAMAGALSGAHLGIEGVPRHLLDKLEDRRKGSSYIRQLAERLYDGTAQAK